MENKIIGKARKFFTERPKLSTTQRILMSLGYTGILSLILLLGIVPMNKTFIDGAKFFIPVIIPISATYFAFIVVQHYFAVSLTFFLIDLFYFVQFALMSPIQYSINLSDKSFGWDFSFWIMVIFQIIAMIIIVITSLIIRFTAHISEK